MPEDATGEVAIYIPPPAGRWSPFDRVRRNAFILLASEGLSIPRACEELRVSPDTVRRWLKLGSLDQEGYDAAVGRKEYGTGKWRAKRDFWLSYREAVAKAENLTHRVIAKCMTGYEYEEEKVTYDQPRGEFARTTVRKRALPDWKAAEALQKRAERVPLLEDERRLKRAQADKEEHLARAARAIEERARHDAERARYLAELSKRDATKVRGAIYWPQTLLTVIEKSDPELHERLMATMQAEGYTLATEADAEQAAQQRDEKRDAELEELERVWQLSQDTPDEGLS